jgi:hypothetical protein
MSSTKRRAGDQQDITTFFSVAVKKAKSLAAAILPASSSSSSSSSGKQAAKDIVGKELDAPTLLRLPEDVLLAEYNAIKSRLFNGQPLFKTDEYGCTLYQGTMQSEG